MSPHLQTSSVGRRQDQTLFTLTSFSPLSHGSCFGRLSCFPPAFWLRRLQSPFRTRNPLAAPQIVRWSYACISSAARSAAPRSDLYGAARG